MGMPFLTAVFALSARHVWRMLLCSLLLLTGCSQLLDTQTQAPVSSSHPGKGEQTAGGHDAVSGVTYDLRPLGTRMAEAFLKSSAKTELNAAPGAVLLVAPLAQRADGIDGEAVTTALMARLNSAGIVLADTRQVAALRQQLEYRSAVGGACHGIPGAARETKWCQPYAVRPTNACICKPQSSFYLDDDPDGARKRRADLA